MSDGLHARIADAERVMTEEIADALLLFSEAVNAAMRKRNEKVIAAIEESDQALREITALYHGREGLPNTADGPMGEAEPHSEDVPT